jgi:hypothetical protein
MPIVTAFVEFVLNYMADFASNMSSVNFQWETNICYGLIGFCYVEGG